VRKLLQLEKVVSIFRDQHSVMVGGFGLVGCPLSLLQALAKSQAGALTIISNNLGESGQGLGKLLLDGRIHKVIGSFFTSNPDVPRAYHNGDLEVELIPQGTLAEAIRAGGAGIGGFYTPTGAGTNIAVGRDQRVIRGRNHLYQESLYADVALIKAHRADEYGNLVYRKSARNFNPMMATAADIVIAEVDEVVPVGSLSPEEIVTPHLFVDHIVLSKGGIDGE